MALEAFPGCDGGDPGSPEHPAIWVFGIEPGRSRLDETHAVDGQLLLDSEYSVEMQLERKWVFNRNAFKLLAVLAGRPIDSFREFARESNVFARNSDGYFKGNLYPSACYGIDRWTDSNRRETGFDNKFDYRAHMQRSHWPKLRSWVTKHQPRLIICAGSSHAKEYAVGLLGEGTKLQHSELATSRKPVAFAHRGDTTLVVLPHLSRALNGHAAIVEAGEFIRRLLASR